MTGTLKHSALNQSTPFLISLFQSIWLPFNCYLVALILHFSSECSNSKRLTLKAAIAIRVRSNFVASISVPNSNFYCSEFLSRFSLLGLSKLHWLVTQRVYSKLSHQIFKNNTVIYQGDKSNKHPVFIAVMKCNRNFATLKRSVLSLSLQQIE